MTDPPTTRRYTDASGVLQLVHVNLSPSSKIYSPGLRFSPAPEDALFMLLLNGFWPNNLQIAKLGSLIDYPYIYR